MKIRSSLFMIFFFLAATFVAAQEDFVVFEGEQSFHQVDFHPGNNYQWEVVTQFKPVINASLTDYNFVSGNDSYEADIQWKKAGQYFLLLTETDGSGCLNSKALSVQVFPNNRSIGFENGMSNSCFNFESNGFQIPVNVLNNNGQKLEKQYFPLYTEFLVNGEIHSQMVEYESQFIDISDLWFSANSNTDTSVVVEITTVSDIDNTPVPVRTGNTKFIYQIFAIPEIEFANTETDTIAQNTSHSFQVGFYSGYSYEWWYTDFNGTRNELSSDLNKTENYYWETEGTFQLFVQATSEYGCVSEIISKTFVVKKEELLIPKLFALPDFTMAYENSVIIGNVGSNDFIAPERSWKLTYNLVGEPLPGLIFNADGSFVFLPPENFVGKLSFSYQVCFEDETLGCANAEALIHLISTATNGNIAPVAATDVALTFPNQIIVSNLLSNDIDPDGDNESLIISVLPVVEPLHGILEIAADGSFSYNPEPGFEGTDKFMYRICDNGTPSLCDSAWVYIIVDEFGGGSSKPISTSDDLFISNKDSVFTLTENDYNLQEQELIYNTNPVISTEHGILKIYPDGTFTYNPDSGYVGIDWFVYEVCSAGENPFCRRGTGFILVNITGAEVISLAGRDTIIGNCNPFVLGGIQPDEDAFDYLWEPALNLDDATLPNPVFTPGNSTLFKLTVTNDFGFYAVDSVNITVADIIADAGDDVSMYNNSSVVLNGNASVGVNIQYEWSTVNGNIEGGAFSANPVVSGFGTYYLEITDQFGCTDYDSVNVGMLTYAPVAVDDYDTTLYQTGVKISVLENDIDAEEDIDRQTLSVTVPPYNGTAYVDYNDYTIHYQPDENFSGTDIFEYRICDIFKNCDEATVTVLVTDFEFFIPNAFSPNADNINDYFEIIGIGEYEGNSIEIINRWGNKVYEAKNYGISTTPRFWDGKSNTGFRLGDEELPSGTYFYILNLGNGEKRIAGSVYLDR